jgi:TolB protein
MKTYKLIFTIALSAHMLAVLPVHAQWNHRYPMQEGARHQVYLESFELPVMGAGPSDPAPSPDGSSLAFAAHGWLWRLDLSGGTAVRLTADAGMDSRPAWSPDGKSIAFVRDNTLDTDLYVLHLESGEVRAVVKSDSIDLDPSYSPDGEYLYYSSGAAGNLDIWRKHLASGVTEQLTSNTNTGADLERRPQVAADTGEIVFISKRSGQDEVVRFNPESGERVVLKQQSIASQIHPGISPNGRSLVLNWPSSEAYDLLLLDLAGGDDIRLNRQGGLPLAPVFSADGQDIYYFEGNENLQFELFRIPVRGGEPERIDIQNWDWGSETAELVINTAMKDGASSVAARVAVTDQNGHPLLSSQRMARFDSSSGRVYQFSGGEIRYEVPAGQANIIAARGLTSPVVKASVELLPGKQQSARLEFQPVWEPRQEGWYAGDHHYHMNYGGPYRVQPQEGVLQLKAEDLDIGTPMLANLQHRFNDIKYFGWRSDDSADPVLLFGQEVRAHFHGHVGLTFIDELFWPWYWGPGYPVYNQDDRSNQEVSQFADTHNAISTYMHPFMSRTPPFDSEDGLDGIPLELIPDAVLGDLDAIEVACIYTHELHVSDIWYRLLNIGVPIAASAGTDTFIDYYRNMAPGTTRLYTRVDGEFSVEKYKKSVKAGRSFISTGPMIRFDIDGAQPGDVISTQSGDKVKWTLMVATTQPVETVEIILNGEVVETHTGPTGSGQSHYSGSIDLPSGGWVAARAHGGDMQWPGMNGVVFGHSSPIWINERGSTEPGAAGRAASDLLKALDNADGRIEGAYGDLALPVIRARFAQARQHLEQIAEGSKP